MTKTESYKDQLLATLADPETAAHYLNESMLDGDPKVFLLALRDVTEARGGMGKLAKRAKLNRENLYRMLGEAGNPSLSSLGAVLDSLGLRLAVEVK